jgi:type VI secretion system protein ImpB
MLLQSEIKGAMAESTHDKLNRVRKPRVHITYQVQIGDAIEKREIPFVVGVMADLSGDRDPKKPLPKVKDRKFTQIDRDEFDKVMEKIEPRLQLSVKNTLENDDSNASMELRFKKLADFSPENVVNQVPAMKELLDARNKLSNLRSSLYGNDKLEELLNDVIKQTSADEKGSKE